MTIQIEEGKFYRTEDRDVVGPMRRVSGQVDGFNWTDAEGLRFWKDNGHFLNTHSHWVDLVAEAPAPAPVIETADGPQTAETPEWAKQVEDEAAAEHHDFGRLSGICSKCGQHASRAARVCSGAKPDQQVDAAKALDEQLTGSQQSTPFPSDDIKAAIADEAKRIVSGARRSAYGKPEQNFERIARFWQAYFENTGRGDVKITAADVSPLMRLMKEARLAESPNHYDSFVDLIGYTLTGAEVNGVSKPT